MTSCSLSLSLKYSASLKSNQYCQAKTYLILHTIVVFIRIIPLRTKAFSECPVRPYRSHSVSRCLSTSLSKRFPNHHQLGWDTAPPPFPLSKLTLEIATFKHTHLTISFPNSLQEAFFLLQIRYIIINSIQLKLFF